MARREEFTIGDRASLSVNVTSGSIDVRVGEPGSAVVIVEHRKADDWEISAIADHVTVQPPRRGRHAARVTVEIPAGTDVDAHAVSADIVLSGDLGDVDLRTTSGDIRIGRAAAVEITTVSGDSRIDRVADTRVKSVSGDLTATAVQRLVATSASGDLRIGEVTGDATIGTTSGDLDIDRFDGTTIAVKSVSGDVRLGLPPGIRVEPDIATISGRTELPAPAPAGSAPVDEPRRVVRVELRTVSGNIILRRAG